MNNQNPKSSPPDAEQFARENPSYPDILELDMDLFDGTCLPDDEIRELIHFSGMIGDDN